MKKISSLLLTNLVLLTQIGLAPVAQAQTSQSDLPVAVQDYAKQVRAHVAQLSDKAKVEYYKDNAAFFDLVADNLNTAVEVGGALVFIPLEVLAGFMFMSGSLGKIELNEVDKGFAAVGAKLGEAVGAQKATGLTALAERLTVKVGSGAKYVVEAPPRFNASVTRTVGVLVGGSGLVIPVYWAFEGRTQVANYEKAVRLLAFQSRLLEAYYRGDLITP